MRRRPEGGSGGNGTGGALSPRERDAAQRLIRRVRREVPAELTLALLFGSKARGTDGPDSDVDVLLVFRDLPPDREPQAGMAERIAEEVEARTGVPVGPWSVSLVDLRRGFRTPMLVDALCDGVPLWPAGAVSPRLPFTPEDADRCTGALLERIAEGSEEFAAHRRRGDAAAALRRGRDDVIRMCTAALLLHGETRPRRAAAARRFVEAYVESGAFPGRHRPMLRWAERSFGPNGKDEDCPLRPPPGGLAALAAAVYDLREWVAARRERLPTTARGRGSRRHPGS